MGYRQQGPIPAHLTHATIPAKLLLIDIHMYTCEYSFPTLTKAFSHLHLSPIVRIRVYRRVSIIRGIQPLIRYIYQYDFLALVTVGCPHPGSD